MTTSTNTMRDEERWLKARVDLVVSSLALTIILNPIWAALSIIPLGGHFPEFGVIAMPVLVGIVALHLGNSVATSVVQRWAHRPGRDPKTVLNVLIVLQVWVSTSWGAGALMCWVDGNAANNTFLALLVIAMMWALALTRSILPTLFAAGVIPLMTMFWVRAIFSDGEAAGIFAFFTPVFAAYAWFMGVSSRDRVNQLLRTRFELEDMTAALEIARQDAVTKSAEAEAASASKSAFVANMSHELRTPLNAILGFAEIIESEAVGQEVPEQYRNYARDIRESGAHLLSLINDMLDVAKIEAGKMELDRQPLDAAYAIDSAMRLIAHRASEKQQTVSAEVDKTAAPFADERAFKQILLNLLSNAVKFSPPSGVITVRCQRAPSGAVRLSVLDSGPGIPADKIVQLFRPFSRVDNRYDRSANGTGLGLALVRGLVALHGGTVHLENRREGGLAAIVDFPPALVHAAA